MVDKKDRILVVDDSIAIVNSLQSILGISGFKVDVAYSGSDALRKLHDNLYDLVICDIEMPGISGLEFLGKVRNDFDRNLDVILMTGYLEHDYFIEAIRLGASDFIRKPIDTKKMISSIRELQHRKRSPNDMFELYKHLEIASFSFELTADRFSKFAVSKIFSTHLYQYFKVEPKILNELLVCVDEMVYNAYIHGTLSLSNAERALPHEELQKVIEDRFQDPQIAGRKVTLSFKVNNKLKEIQIEVADEGNGFDHQSWRQNIPDTQFMELKEHGRGLAMLYHLCDDIRFEDGGRRVRVRKRLTDSRANEDSSDL